MRERLAAGRVAAVVVDWEGERTLDGGLLSLPADWLVLDAAALAADGSETMLAVEPTGGAQAVAAGRGRHGCQGTGTWSSNSAICSSGSSRHRT